MYQTNVHFSKFPNIEHNINTGYVQYIQMYVLLLQRNNLSSFVSLNIKLLNDKDYHRPVEGHLDIY